METIQGAKIVASFKKAGLWLSLLVVMVGFLVEIGWQMDINWLKTPLQGTIFMNPLTAIGFILTGLSIQIAGRIKTGRFIWLVKLGGLLVALLGLSRFVAIVWGWDAGIDQILFRDKLLENRIAPNTALNFVFIGIALFFIAKEKYYKLVHGLCFVTAMLSFLAILGYFYSVMNLYAFLEMTPMALNTAIAFLMSSLAILFTKPERGLIWIFCADSAGGKIARMLMPMIIIVPSILCKLVIWSHDTGSIDLRLGFVLFNAILMSVFLFLTYRIVNRLDRIDFERQLGERGKHQLNESLREVSSDLDRELKESQNQNKLLENTKRAMLNVLEDLEKARSTIEIEKLKDEAMMASIGEGFVAVDNQGKVIVMNRVAEKMLGLKVKDVLGKKITNLRLEDEAGKVVPLARRPTTLALASGEIAKVTYYFVRNDKSRFPMVITATPIKLGSEITGLVEIIRDITKEKEIDRAKSEFISLASHQLRTPLGIMKWYLEVLEKNKYFLKSPAVIKKYFDEIYI